MRCNNPCSSISASICGSGEGIGLFGATGERVAKRTTGRITEVKSALSRTPSSKARHIVPGNMKVMVVVEILRDRDAQQQIEGLDPRRILPQPQVQVVGL